MNPRYLSTAAQARRIVRILERFGWRDCYVIESTLHDQDSDRPPVDLNTVPEGVAKNFYLMLNGVARNIALLHEELEKPGTPESRFVSMTEMAGIEHARLRLMSGPSSIATAYKQFQAAIEAALK